MSEKPEQTPSKAALLANELKQEKKRLEQELEELHTDYENIKPTTPTGTVDWAVKWMAVTLGVIGVFLFSADLILYGQICYISSAIAWIYVGMNWGDRAIMIGSSISGTAVAMNLLQSLLS
jgi:hypothetical protein